LLIGTATKRDLSLASRGWIREPAGWMIGYAPGGDPSLTLVGLSYELGPWFDLFGAYGFGEKDEDTERRWLFGASLNLTRFLKGLTEALPEGEQ
jgi:hypothetical protein